ncbi:TonB-dependent receptor plug domain-containing protein [Flavobacterium sp.]|uniref:TonB-dependent receptor plug domain-containing protein n=1 Tax=Flavobacterium sp. TaxID=239 RepID=UPI00286B3CC1|nr:TonB-dependent receptor plug domain-containing protein [Flavobacterium sp.]
MKPIVTLLIFLLLTPISWSQKVQQHYFDFTSTKLSQALSTIETQFDVKYSYVDSIVAPKVISVVHKKYTLTEINAEIESQTSLKITPIDARYYSVSQSDEEPIGEEQLQEILVEGFLSKGINKSNQKVILSPQKIEALPGVTDADVLLSLQQLPGVKSPNETASGLYVRGGTSDQNLILWDGIRMYHPGHLFGMISGFNPNVSQTVHYQNKGTHPKFGERISSVIEIQSTDKIEDTLKVDAGINALNADVYIKAPLLKKTLGLQLSGRKSFTEWLQTATFNSLAEKVFQNTNFKNFDDRNKFQFEDYSAKLNYKPNEKTDLSFTSIWIDNNLNFTTETETDGIHNQKMMIENQGFSLNWNQQYGSKWNQKTLLYYSAYTFDYKKNKNKTADTFELFQKLNRVTDSGVESSFDYKVNSKLNVELGYQLSGNAVSHSFTSESQDLSIILDQKQLYSITHSGYSFLKYKLETWNFQAGARYNYFSSLKSNSFEPRLFIQKNITNALIFQTSYERKSQIMSQVRESVVNDLSLENYLWILSDNENYPIQKANQYTLGLIYKTQSWVFDVDAYYKMTKGITSLTFGFLNQFDSTMHQGKGFTKGLDVLIQKNAPTWRTWMTYTFQDSQNRFEDLNDNHYFAINADIKHAFNISFYKKWNHYSLSTGWFWHTGKPYSLLDATNQVESFNTERLPAYHRLDISGMYHFHEQKAWSGKVGFSIYNAYNQRSLISKEYERQYATIGSTIRATYKVQDYYSLGITPNVFVRVAF